MSNLTMTKGDDDRKHTLGLRRDRFQHRCRSLEGIRPGERRYQIMTLTYKEGGSMVGSCEPLTFRGFS